MTIRRLLTVFSIAVLFVVMTGCGASKDDLRNQIKTLQEKKYELEEKLEKQAEKVQSLELERDHLKKEVDTNSSNTYIGWKFWKDGNYYIVGDEEFKFYSDITCQKEVKEKLKIISPIVSKEELKNGFIIYTVLSEEGLMYSTDEPSLEIEEQE